MGSVIDQSANFRADFGAIFRSSAIFYIPQNTKTTLSVSNYWDFKNQIEVGVVLTRRTMQGQVVSRTEHRFDEANVLNIEVADLTQGSVEIESFSSRNLRIPYSAVMAVYETENSVSMVHSYGRNHSLIELEDHKSLTLGRESCWTLRAAGRIRNSAVFHNGHCAVPAQRATIILSNQAGQEEHHPFDMPALEPFATHLFEIDVICPDYRQFLQGCDGWATVHFENSTAFTRLLILWQDPDSQELQVTHSNFDYAEHETSTIVSDKPAYMKLPHDEKAGPLYATVYPRFTPGEYEATTIHGVVRLNRGVNLPADVDCVSFRRLDGALPARIVTGIVGNHNASGLPFECSLGVVHDQRPPKRFHWAIVSRRLHSKILLTDYREIYQEPEQGIELIVSLYNADNLDIAKVSLSYASLAELPVSLDPAQLFGVDWEALGGQFAYVSIFCAYGGLYLFSSMETAESYTLEHSF